jgi:hypothetical protein
MKWPELTMLVTALTTAYISVYKSTSHDWAGAETGLVVCDIQLKNKN